MGKKVPDNKTRLILVMIILFIIVSITRIQTNNPKYELLLQEAQQEIENKEYNKAIILYQQAISIDKKNPLTYIKLSSLYRDRNRPQEALTVLLGGLKKAKDINELSYNLGELYLEIGLFEDAQHAFITIEPPNDNTLKKLAEVYYKKGEPNEALAILTTIQQKDNESLFLESLYYLFDEPEKAREILGTIDTTLDTENIKKITNILSMETSEYQQLLLCKELLNQKYPAITLPILKEMNTTAINKRDVSLMLGSAYFQNNQEETAREIWKQAILIDPSHGETYYLLAQYYKHQNLKNDAIAQIEKAIYLEQNNYTYRQFLAELYLDTQNCHQAIETQKIVITNLANWQTNETINANKIKLIKYYQQCEDGVNALLSSEKLKNSELPQDKKEIAEELYLWSNWIVNQNQEISLKEYTQYLNNYPFSPQGHYHYGLILEKAGNNQEALKQKDRAYELDLNGEITSIIQ